MGCTLARLSRALTLACATGALVFTTCGGGSGSDDAQQPNALAGAYHYLALARDGSDDVRSETGQVTSDGLGTLTFASSYVCEEGTTIGPLVRTPMSYALASDRSITVIDPGALTYEGRMGVGGAEVAVSSVAGAEHPEWMLLVRRATNPVQGDLAGDWGLHQWHRRLGTGEYAVSARGRVTIDGAGQVSFNGFTYNADGQIDPVATFFLPHEIVVTSGGWVEGRNASSHTTMHAGAISEDRNLILLGNVDPAGYAFVRILVRVNGLAGDAVLAESFACHGFRYSGAVYETWSGTFDFDGAGTGGWGRRYHSGSVGYYTSRSMQYGPIAEGVVGILSSGTFVHVGQIGTNARYVVLAGFFDAGNMPLLDFLVR